jgi:hypothetical protein
VSCFLLCKLQWLDERAMPDDPSSSDNRDSRRLDAEAASEELRRVGVGGRNLFYSISKGLH